MANTVHLPAEGRAGDPPDWPLGSQSDVEAEVWAGLWALPQAVVWERMQWTRTVARYVRALSMSESTFVVSLLGEVRQLEDRLGLTPMAMLRLRWEVVADEVGEQRTAKKAAPRKRLRAVD